MSEKKKGPGGKLNRSEIVQTRLSPKLRLAAEILARIEKRTVSSLIERLIEEAAKSEKVSKVRNTRDHQKYYFCTDKKHHNVFLNDAVEQIWSPNEADQFAAFAMSFPHLLTPQEYLKWEFICITAYFWEHFALEIDHVNNEKAEEEYYPNTYNQGLIRENLNKFWSIIDDVFEGRQPAENLEKIPIIR